MLKLNAAQNVAVFLATFSNSIKIIKNYALKNIKITSQDFWKEELIPAFCEHFQNSQTYLIGK
jgi:hypothetical protein